MTHGPPLGRHDGSILGSRAGCLDLLNEIQQRVRPAYHLFGHIHESYGASSDGNTTFVNAASMDCKHEPTHQPFIFELPHKCPGADAEDLSGADDVDAMKQELEDVRRQIEIMKSATGSG